MSLHGSPIRAPTTQLALEHRRPSRHVKSVEHVSVHVPPTQAAAASAHSHGCVHAPPTSTVLAHPASGIPHPEPVQPASGTSHPEPVQPPSVDVVTGTHALRGPDASGTCPHP
ncbi:hypothetical protein MVI01_68320 [Myxococcus virescens]|uniref:Uncharacterized protein n=1 Tax=Myxococcus virescens TaxID=83456 RepID=A0A511HN82_9BACT|nr:hypothetical protein MVI01_68320 [Myxococcus virescens]